MSHSDSAAPPVSQCDTRLNSHTIVFRPTSAAPSILWHPKCRDHLLQRISTLIFLFLRPNVVSCSAYRCNAATNLYTKYNVDSLWRTWLNGRALFHEKPDFTKEWTSTSYKRLIVEVYWRNLISNYKLIWKLHNTTTLRVV